MNDCSTAALVRRAASEYLGLAPLARLSINGADLQAVAHGLLQQAAADGDNAVLWMNLATALFACGLPEQGQAVQAQALAMVRSYRIAARQPPARLRVLMLMAPGDLAENTPLDCLLEASPEIELICHFSCPEAPLPEPLPAHDVLLVALSDTVSGQPIRARLTPLLRHWPTPVINRPEHIPNTERRRASERLQGVPGLLMPHTRAVSRADLADLAAGGREVGALCPDCRFPIILRPLGSQAGRDLARLEDADAVARYLARVAGEDFYLSRFVDYSGADGRFRKARVALVDGVPYACHMAVSSHWMVHYVNAGMYEDAAKRAEEAAFEADFAVFARRHAAALAAIHQRIGLDYVCIDCAETRDGQLLVFEVDHVMVVHAMDSPEVFPYKQVHMGKVRRALERYLRACATPVAEPC